MKLEDFLAAHPGWRVEQHPFKPQFRAVDEQHADRSVTADTIDELHARFGACAAKMAA